MHQADLLFLSFDTVKVGRTTKTYKYTLTLVDVGTRYKEAEPLTSNYSKEVVKAFEKIYSRYLKYPKLLQVDPGKEFIVQALISVQALVFDLAQLTCQKKFDCRNAILGSSAILLGTSYS